ncbi:uncharacterized protein MEPE_06398 [Melanopsichium pennsylvanicum]|uniref:tRNA-splicing endonuclease subunit Sen54 N-terminal domain-containing protein n=2 Tax=Melanopsichium pennsylvanicum TaxID=63383 RepID=A0AAJ5C8L4_9BASI|nr:conserved hypothetical protein [Melanopsichium pennsylvanicum 4]SNX87688.1 uncharacterized protein MEPE_06398 [Melanopsichium pennsylvanicum]
MSQPTTPHRATKPSTSSSRRDSPSTPVTPLLLDVQEDMDDPTATPTAYIRNNAPSSSSPRHIPSSTTNPADDSADEDEAPDYLRLLSTLNPKSKSTSTSNSSSAAGIVIPKRGEKDFEPTGFGGQAKLLERSREAMFQAVSGERKVGSRTLVRAIWNAERCRATLLDVQGKIFETVGVIRREQTSDPKTGKNITKASNELLPEEALFLAERGSLQIYTKEGEQARMVPMSLQQAFATLMMPGEDGKRQDEPLTREAYLIFAYLKRLGYVVQRASIVDSVRAAPISASTLAKKNNNSSSGTGSSNSSAAFTQDQLKAEGIIADPQRPVKLVTIWDVLLYIPRRIAQLTGDAAGSVMKWVQWVWRKTIARFIAMIATQTVRIMGEEKKANKGNAGTLGLALGLKSRGDDGRQFLGEKGNVDWDSHDAVFSSLQIVPSGHDFWLPSSSPSSISTTTHTTALSSTSTNATSLQSKESLSVLNEPGSQTREANKLKPFYYAYRPATQYRKSHPPPPEFRIVILNARTTLVPSVFEFENLFAHIPIPGSDAELFGTLPSSHSTTAFGGADSDQAVEAEVNGSTAMTEEQVKQRVEYEKMLKASNEAKNRAAYGKFSEGKQKYLREKAASRQAAIAQRKSFTTAASQAGIWKRLSRTLIGKALIKVLLLDFGLLKVVARLFRHCPPGCWSETKPKHPNNNNHRGKNGRFNKGGAGGKGSAAAGRGGTGNPFPALKAGRRTVVVAVVDGSITTLLRFGESEFEKWALFGMAPHPNSAQQGQEKSKGEGTSLTK